MFFLNLLTIHDSIYPNERTFVLSVVLFYYWVKRNWANCHEFSRIAGMDTAVAMSFTLTFFL